MKLLISDLDGYELDMFRKTYKEVVDEYDSLVCRETRLINVLSRIVAHYVPSVSYAPCC